MTADDILEYAIKSPDRTALVHNGMRYSYRDFALRLGHALGELAKLRLPPGALAAVKLDNLLDAWITVLALQRLGLDTVALRTLDRLGPLDLGPLSLIVADEDAAAVSQALPAGRQARYLPLPAGSYSGPAHLSADPWPEPCERAGGNILVTSGTTGRWKKVLITAADLAGGQERRRQLFDLTSTSVAGIHNLGLWTSLGYCAPPVQWSMGASVVIEQRPKAASLFAASGLTHVFALPGQIAELLAEREGAFPRRDGLEVFVGGGPLPLAHARLVKARLTNKVSTYVAASEVGPWARTRFNTDEDLRWHRIHPTCEVEVVGPDGAPAPPGREGLVRIRPVFEHQGYLGDPEASAEFYRDGFWYPGDLAILRDDGRICLNGRVTEVINVRGQKIATTPLERALADRLGVEGVCIFSAPDAEGAEALHVAIASPAPISRSELETAARATLSGFPAAHFHRVDALPYSPAGKVSRQALKQQILG